MIKVILNFLIFINKTLGLLKNFKKIIIKNLSFFVYFN